MSKEIWKPIPDFSGYEVSSHGRVRSYKLLGRGNRVAGTPQRILKEHVARDGRPHVILRKDSKGYTIYPARLVIEVFAGPRPEGMEVCHNDGNPANNHVDNLRYDTHIENMNDFVKHTRGVDKRERDAEIRRRYMAGVTAEELSREYNLSAGHITNQICPDLPSPYRQQKLREATQMRYDREAGMSYVDIGTKYGVTATQAQYVCQGKYYPEAPGPIAVVNHRK